MKGSLLFITFLVFLGLCTQAQTKADTLSLRKLYEGNWYSKSTNRHLTISFDEEVDYATISDWKGRWKADRVDVYKAFIKGDKLVMYAENEDHHCPYCEMEIKDDKLIYQCNEGFNYSDQFLNVGKATSKAVYKRVK